jgi:glycosyltransferase involved in cell wall biosynthesis
VHSTHGLLVTNNVRSEPRELSVIVAVYNEEEVLDELYRRLTAALQKIGRSYEVLLIDDGSRDRSLEIMRRLRDTDPEHIRIHSFTRNFGHHIALTAGLDHANGDVVVMMDADLQDQPEEMHKLLAKLDDGYDVVWGEREERQFKWYKNFTSQLFLWIMNSVVKSEVKLNSSIYRAMRRPVAEDLRQLREKARFLPGLVTWLGYRQTSTPVVHGARFAGETKYSVWKLLKLALATTTSFSSRPLQLATIVGMGTAAITVFFLFYIVLRKVLGGYPVGYASIIFSIFFFGALQLIVIGLMGEYISRIYSEAQGRPLYLLKDLGTGPAASPIHERPAITDSAKVHESRIASAEEIHSLLLRDKWQPNVGVFSNSTLEAVTRHNLDSWSKAPTVLPQFCEDRLAAVAFVTELEWDTRLLGRRSARVLHSVVDPALPNTTRIEVATRLAGSIDRFAKERHIELMDARLSNHDLLVMRAFEGSGFHTVDMLVTLGVSRESYDKVLSHLAQPSGFTIREMRGEDRKPLADLSYEAYGETDAIQDRFFLEPTIQHEKAQSVFREWFENLAKKHESGEGRVFVADISGRAIGYLAMEKMQTPSGGLIWKDSLNAIDRSARGMGAYKALVSCAIEHARSTNADALITKTQSSTERVINTWLHMRGNLLESFVTLHWTA